MDKFSFTGEESARFTRFANACLAIGIKPSISVQGREPLTSRAVALNGTLDNANLDGYIRYVVIKEEQSGITYWVAGSNSTRSLAAKIVTYELAEEDISKLKEYSKKISLHVPRIKRNKDEIDDILWSIETSLQSRSVDGLNLLLNSLTHNDNRVVLEAALTLRAYSSFIVKSGRRQHNTEEAILKSLNSIEDTESRIALVEDLGYVGTEDALSTLKALLKDDKEHEHVRWASAIAIGRLPSVNPAVDLTPGLSCQLEWTHAATLLSMTRHCTETNRKELEHVFREYLKAEKSPLLIRYACLGLSKFDKHEESTNDFLNAILGDSELQVSVRGYAALALASALSHSSKENRSQTRHILEHFSKSGNLNLEEPESIWGVEFLAELASLLEMSEVSSTLHGVLADSFDDWRSAYYTCMKYYEMGESSARRGLGDDAIHSYHQALSALNETEKTLPPEAKATIQFRRDIVEARQNLHSILGSWLYSMDDGELRTLKESLATIRETYLRYGKSGTNIGADRQLADREIAYIKNTSDLISVIQKLIEFDILLRNRAFKEDEVNLILQQLQSTNDLIKHLQGRFETTFALSLRDVVDFIITELSALENAFLNKEVELPHQLRIARSTMTKVRSRFWNASWPMPGRACPVYGLGRASIEIHKEGFEGDGSENNPLIFPDNVEPVVLVTIQILEMAPGGSTNLFLEYTIGNETRKRNIPIVEDQHTCSIHLGNPIPAFVPVKCDMELKFHARDCTQIAEKIDMYLKGRKM